MYRLLTIIGLTLCILFFGITLYSFKEAYRLLPISQTPPMTPFIGWVPLKAEHSLFRVLFPSFPQHATQTLDGRLYDMYAAQGPHNSTFMISAIHFDTTTPPSSSDLRNGVNDLLATDPTNRLEKMEVASSTVDFTIKSSKTELFGRAFIHQNTLFFLTVIFQNNTVDPAAYQYFVDSFSYL